MTPPGSPGVSCTMWRRRHVHTSRILAPVVFITACQSLAVSNSSRLLTFSMELFSYVRWTFFSASLKIWWTNFLSTNFPSGRFYQIPFDRYGATRSNFGTIPWNNDFGQNSIWRPVEVSTVWVLSNLLIMFSSAWLWNRCRKMHSCFFYISAVQWSMESGQTWSRPETCSRKYVPAFYMYNNIVRIMIISSNSSCDALLIFGYFNQPFSGVRPVLKSKLRICCIAELFHAECHPRSY